MLNLGASVEDSSDSADSSDSSPKMQQRPKYFINTRYPWKLGVQELRRVMQEGIDKIWSAQYGRTERIYDLRNVRYREKTKKGAGSSGDRKTDLSTI